MPDTTAVPAQHDDANTVVDLTKMAAEKAKREADEQDNTWAELLVGTNAGNAKMFGAKYRARVRFCADEDTWLVFVDGRWRKDKSAEHAVRQLAIDMVKDMPNDTAADKEWRKKSLSTRNITDMLTLAKGEPELAVNINQLNTKVRELNTPGGIVDLETGVLHPHNSDALHTQITRVTPAQVEGDPDWKTLCPRWWAFLHWAFDGDQEMINYVQMLLSRALIGEQLDHHCVIWEGEGRNGKGTINRTMLALLGTKLGEFGYAIVMQKGLLTGRADFGLAELRDARYVTGDELNRNEKFDTGLLKQLTGGDPITGDAKHQKNQTFNFGGSIFIGTNFLPTSDGSDPALFRRIIKPMMPNVVKDDDIDPTMEKTFQGEEAPYILAWLVEGAVKFLADGLPPKPQAIRDSVSEYERSQDHIGRFISERLVMQGDEGPRSDAFRVPRKVMRAMYTEWCKDEGVEAEKAHTFTNRFKKLGGECTNGGDYYRARVLRVEEK